MSFFWSRGHRRRQGFTVVGALLLSLPTAAVLVAQEDPQQGQVGEIPQEGQVGQISQPNQGGQVPQQAQVGEFPRQAQAGPLRDVRLTIDTDRKTYRVGDSVAVRLSLTNMSENRIPFVPQPPWALATLIITRNGQALPRGAFGAGVGTTGQPAFLGPKESRFWNWQDHLWFSLRHWGYDLRQPGQYTIVGTPRNASATIEPDSVRSNQATFTILP